MDEGTNHLFNTILKRLDKIETRFISLEDAYKRHLTSECLHREELKTTIGKMAIRISELAGLHNSFVEDTDTEEIQLLKRIGNLEQEMLMQKNILKLTNESYNDHLVKGHKIKIDDEQTYGCDCSDCCNTEFSLKNKSRNHIELDDNGCMGCHTTCFSKEDIAKSKAEILKLLELKAKHYSNLIHLKDAEEVINKVLG